MEKKVSEYCANAFGLMHILGNVWQWTAYRLYRSPDYSFKDLGFRLVRVPK